MSHSAVETPAFLLWSLEYTCQVRGFESGREPERIERLLRAARSGGDAMREGRVLDGICVSPPYGFRLTEALKIYDGRETVEACCTACPANAVSRLRPGTWAGCFGLVPLLQCDEVEQRLAVAVDGDSVKADYARLFTGTRPIWNGLWLRSPIDSERAKTLAAILQVGGLAQLSPEFADLEAGLKVAVDENLKLHVIQYPPGRVEQAWWRLAAHCPWCKAVWGDLGDRRCDVCAYVGPPAPDRKRRARGRRPYLLLERLLGPSAAAEFLNGYEAFRAQPARPNQAQTPLQPEPPDTLPAG